MANFDFEPPSFSLGLDLDLETQPSSITDPLFQTAQQPSTTKPHYEDDFGSPVRVSGPPPSLKRLRRGYTAPKAESFSNEDIEDFSSEDDWPRATGVLPPTSVCSSSKYSLCGLGAVTTESGSQLKSSKGKEVASVSASVNVGKKYSNVMFPKLTVSPLRRYQLIDSDSDDPTLIEDPGREVPYVVLSPENKHLNSRSTLESRRASAGKYLSEDLWRDFRSQENSPIHTPAFDEVLEEYFTDVKNKRETEFECKDTCNETECDRTIFPLACHYFFHKDSRIQKLVRDRLPFFFPLGAGNSYEHKEQNVLVIDYMGQFGHEETRRTDQRRNAEKRSTGSKKIFNQSQVDSKSQASNNWVNPRSCRGAQKNAGSRRVQAVSKSAAGHWFTGSDGQRVYVNKQGHEMTGQIAYKHYRKESGLGLKNSTKKPVAAKRKTSGKKKAAPKKK